MPVLIDTESRTGTLVQAINDVLTERGPAGVTLRLIARLSGVSPSSMLHHFGSREHLLRVAAGRTGRQRIASLRVEAITDGVLAFVPRSDDEVLDTRAWLAWLELWRCEQFLGRWIAEARADELALLARVTGYRLTRPELDAALALIDGLRVAVCAPVAPMPPHEARQILSAHLGSTADVTFHAAGGSSM